MSRLVGFKMIPTFGTIISAVLLMVVRPGIGKDSCTTLADLADPCGCPFGKESFEPICGSDGQTYLNACFLHCKETLDGTSIRVQRKGACSADSLCTCNAGYNPVCGSNGITYSNDCVLNCNIKKDSSLYLKNRGKCGGYASHDQTRWFRSLRETRKCYCNPADGPICASNGVTYTNYCVMRCKNYQDRTVDFVHWGECQEPINEVLIDEYWSNMKRTSKKLCSCGYITYYTRCGGNVKAYNRPLCECDAKNYPVPVKTQNPCDEIDQLTHHRLPRPTLPDPKTCYCAAVNRPVCGSDDETYANICVLHCNAKTNPSLVFGRWGSCRNTRLVSRLKERPENNEEETLRL